MLEDIEELKEKSDLNGLLRILQEGDVKRRADAAKAIGMIQEEIERDDVPPALVERLKKDEDPTVRGNAALALGHLRSEVGKKALKEAVEDQNWEVRHDTAIAMGEYREKDFIDDLFSLLKDDEAEVKRKSIEALGNIGKKIKSEEIIFRLKDFLDKDEFKEEAVRAVGRIDGEEAVDVLSEVYENSEREVREIAINGLGKIEGEKADKMLIKALKDDSWRVREDAARLLGERKVEEAVDDLIFAVEDEKSYVVQSALRSLGEVGKESDEILSTLKEKLESENAETRTAAAEAVEKLDSKRSGKILLEALRSEQNPRVLWSISDSLSNLSNKRLKDLKKDVETLGGEMKFFGAFALGKAGFYSQLDTLLEMIDDERWKVRQKAAEAVRGIDAEDLSKGKAKRVLKKLSSSIEDNDKWVRVEAVKSLKEMLFDLKEKFETEEFESQLLRRIEVEVDEDVKDELKRAKNFLKL